MLYHFKLKGDAKAFLNTRGRFAVRNGPLFTEGLLIVADLERVPCQELQ